MTTPKYPTYEQAWAEYEAARERVKNSPQAQKLLKAWEEMENDDPTSVSRMPLE